MATTEAEWLAALPRAVGKHPCAVHAGRAEIRIHQGRLLMQWHTLPPRVIALLRLQRLAVVFAFDGVDDAERHAFMKHFDLTMQRGGG